MRHLVKGRKLGRTSSHRKATLQALSIALIQERRIQTTLAKAKELRGFVEPLITRAKVDSTHNRRQVFSKLQDKYAVRELFEEVGPSAKDRPGGYTRVIKIGSRLGDATDMALIELVDYNDVKPESGKSDRKRTRRAGQSSKPESTKPAASKPEVTEEETTQVHESSEIEQDAVPVADEAQDTSDAVEASVTTASDDDVQDENSADFTVKEVKERIADMDVEEAKEFIGDDERVTFQKALEKKESDSDESEESEEK